MKNIICLVFVIVSSCNLTFAQTEAELDPTIEMDYYDLIPFTETWDFEKKPYKSITIMGPLGGGYEVRHFDSLGRTIKIVIGKGTQITRNIYKNGILVSEVHEQVTSDGEDHIEYYDDGMATKFSNSKSGIEYTIDSTGKRTESISYSEEGGIRLFYNQIWYDTLERPYLKKQRTSGGSTINYFYNNKGLLARTVDSVIYKKDITTYTYTHDGKISTRLVLNFSNYRGEEKTSLEMSDSFFYQNGMLTRKKSENKYWVWTKDYAYNENQNLLLYHYEERSIEQNKILKWQSTSYTYEGDSLVKIRKERMMNGQEEIPWIWELRYNEKGQLSEIQSYFFNKPFKDKTTLFYNEHGHLIKKHKQHSSSENISEWTYQLEYFP